MESRGLHCTTCGHVNREAAKFCEQCGTPLRDSGLGARDSSPTNLVLRAPSPEPPAPSLLSYTPKHLVEKILQSRSALEGERKQVTVLFADVKGSMELAEQVDAEEWHRIMDRFFAILTEGVHRFEGTINQYTGDGIMALFGAPIAHEDHARRACFAALQLRDGLRRYADELRVEPGLNFSVRMGMNSGEVVVGKIGDDLRMDYTAQGPTVGLAARMEQLAEPGKVLLTENTAKLVSGYFALRDLGPAKVKGVSHPLRLYELEDVGQLRSRFEASQARGLSKFVGRSSEMAVLDAALERAAAGHGQVVGIVAEPGVGKSRLCHEFAQRCRARGLRVPVAHGVPHGQTIPLLAWMELLRNYLGVTDADSDEAARDKIAGRLLRLDPTIDDLLPVLFEFLDVPDPHRAAPPMDPEVRQQQLFEISKRSMRARTRRGELLVPVFEDLHWFDAGSAHFLADMVAAVHGTSTLVLVNFRPEFHADWMHLTYYEQIALHPLGEEAVAELLDDLLGTDPSVRPLAGLIRERTAGNPFFIEEVVRDLVESGHLDGTRGGYRLSQPVSGLEIPATVQAILAARIDRLAERDKRLLQTAAVIGKEFALSVLQRVAEDLQSEDGGPRDAAEDAASLHTLLAAEFVDEKTTHPEVVYVFRHPLTQEVAYRSQLSERRAVIHAAVARAIEATYPSKLDEHAALLAHHWELANEPLRAAEWHHRAATWVGGRDRREMLRHWRQVRALLERVPESPATIALGLQARQQMLTALNFIGTSPEETATLFAEGMALAARLEGSIPRLHMLTTYALTRLFAGAVDDSLRYHREALALAEESGDQTLRFAVRVSLLSTLVHAGLLTEALACSREAEELSGGDVNLAAELVGFSLLGVTFTNRAQTLMYLGHLEEADVALQRAREIAQQRRDLEVLSMTHVFHVVACEISGDAESAITHARRAVELSGTTPSRQLRIGAFGALGIAHLLRAEWQEAREAFAEVFKNIQESGRTNFLEAMHMANLAEAHLGCGDADAARALTEQALAVARTRHTPVHELYVLLQYAQITARTDGQAAIPAIETALQQADALIERTGARAYVPFVTLRRAQLAGLRGDTPAQQQHLRAAHEQFLQLGAPWRAARIAPLPESRAT